MSWKMSHKAVYYLLNGQLHCLTERKCIPFHYCYFKKGCENLCNLTSGIVMKTDKKTVLFSVKAHHMPTLTTYKSILHAICMISGKQYVLF